MPKQKVTGFTLVELLIVIALIAILSVAVLATINPIEQTNKAKDSTVQNDSAEVMNAYERYYTSQTRYPWMEYTEGAGNEVTVDDAIVVSSTQAGFGICYGAPGASWTQTGVCNTSGANLGLLVERDELKSAFVNKSEFQDPGDNNENSLWMAKSAGSGGGIYVCYIPKAKANRAMAEKLYCLDSTNNEIIRTGDTGTAGACAALAVSSENWSTPTLNGLVGMFRCVPE